MDRKYTIVVKEILNDGELKGCILGLTTAFILFNSYQSLRMSTSNTRPYIETTRIQPYSEQNRDNLDKKDTNDIGGLELLDYSNK